jgi:hypothetical protein
MRCYIPLFIVWYFVIFMIGTVLAVVACRRFNKAQMRQDLVVMGYLILLGLVTLYVSWASTITWAFNMYAENGERAYFVSILFQPAVVAQIALQVSVESEATSTRHGRSTRPAVFYYFLEAVFAIAAPAYKAYRRYNESD